MSATIPLFHTDDRHHPLIMKLSPAEPRHCLIILNPNTLAQYFSNFKVFKNHLRTCENADSYLVGLEWGSRFFIPNKFPDDAEATGLKTTLTNKALHSH